MERLDRIVGFICENMDGIMIAACIIFVLGLAGCATTPRGSFCQIAEPHRFSDAAIDAMSDAQITQELRHNKVGEKLCGWRP